MCKRVGNIIAMETAMYVVNGSKHDFFYYVIIITNENHINK